jgi:hypothetical protein
MWLRSGSMAAPSTRTLKTPIIEPKRRLCTPLVSSEIGCGEDRKNEEKMKAANRNWRSCSDRFVKNRVMDDFYSFLGVIGFAMAMLGLIWALDRV